MKQNTYNSVCFLFHKILKNDIKSKLRKKLTDDDF